MGLGKILKLFGLYKVNKEYMKPVDEKIEAVEEDLGAVSNVADCGSRTIDALDAKDLAKAVEVAMEFCKIDDEVKELKGIKEKVDGGESIQAAVSAANGPGLTKEIVESVMREVTGSYEKMSEIVSSIVAAGEEAAEKVKNFTSAAANWSFAEKIGTPEAMGNTGKKAKKIKDAAEEAKSKLEALKESIAKIG